MVGDLLNQNQLSSNTLCLYSLKLSNISVTDNCRMILPEVVSSSNSFIETVDLNLLENCRHVH